MPGDSMNRDWFKPLVAMMWLMLAFSAASYWQAWDQLPNRMAVHFDANWQPNGYTSREGAVMLGLGIMAVMLVLFACSLNLEGPQAERILADPRSFLPGFGHLLDGQPLHCGFQFASQAGPFQVGGPNLPGNS